MVEDHKLDPGKIRVLEKISHLVRHGTWALVTQDMLERSGPKQKHNTGFYQGQLLPKKRQTRSHFLLSGSTIFSRVALDHIDN